MKKIFFALITSGIFFAQCSPKVGETVATGEDKMESTAGKAETMKEEVVADINDFRKTAPEPGPAPKIEVGSADNFTLSNGLKVFVVENHKLPKVSFQVFVDFPPFMEGEYAGTADIAGQLLSTGTITKSKAEIDEAVDFMGASLNTSSSGLYAASLRKHTEELMKIASDVLLKPSFPEAEFEKIKKQTLSFLAQGKEDPNAIARNVSSILKYGKDHPYGEIQTEETVSNITLEQTKKFYNEYMKPNASYVIVVGDITAAEAKPLVEKYFGNWISKPVPKKTFPMPQKPAKPQVDFVSKSGAVQSIINITYPVDLKPGTDDVIKARVMNVLLGGFFGSRINQNIREDKGYTYGARSSLSYDEYIGAFTASAPVRNEVTAPAITEFLNELNRIRDEKVSEEELTLVKNYMTGSFALSLENPQTVARFALNTARYNLPDDYYATYLEKLSAVTADDIQAMAKKYITPQNAHILVVGNKSEVAESLTQFAADGNINYYDAYGNRLVIEESAMTADMTAQQVLDKYIAAIGGKDKLMAVKDLSMSMEADVMGQKIAMSIVQKSPGMVYQSSSSPMGKQESILNGDKGKVMMGTQSMPMPPEQVASAKEQAILFTEMQFDKLGYEAKLVGTENVNGANAFVIETTSPSGQKQTLFFDTKTNLKIKESSSVKGPNGQLQNVSTDLSDYQEVNGILFPFSRKLVGAAPIPLDLKVTEIKVNSGVSDDMFKVE
ncbi:MAG: insulinase family protein [Bacteroidota bacterium]